MGRIKIENIKSGMVLSSDVRDHRGDVLLRAGEKIERKNLRIFRIWGITEVDIQDVAAEDAEYGSTESLEPAAPVDVQNQVQQLFQHADSSHPAVKELVRIRMKRFASQETSEAVYGS
jgi:hypothetical protein